MKKVLISIFILLGTVTLNAANLDITSIDFIKKNAKNEDFYVIQGVLTEKTGDNEYMFQDSSGERKIIVRDFILREKGLNDLPLNTTMTLKVIINREILENMKVIVFGIVDMNESPTESSLNITSLTDIQQNANNNDIFTIKGIIIQATDIYDNQYHFQDESGMDAAVSVKKLAFKEANIDKFNDGDHVVLKVIFHKDSKGTWLEAYKIVELNNDIKP